LPEKADLNTPVNQESFYTTTFLRSPVLTIYTDFLM